MAAKPVSTERANKGLTLHPFWMVGLLAWTSLFLFASSTIYISGFRPLALILQVTAGLLVPLALMTPFVFGMAQRYPLSFQTWRAHLWKHVLASAFFCAVCASVSSSVLTALQPKILAACEERFRREFPELNIPREELAKYIALFLPPELRSSRLDLSTLASNAFKNAPPYWVLLVFAHALIATARLREREQQAAELEAHLARAQLEGLRTQLQPHFLFNTLNSISALIPQDARLANAMLLNLSDLLRMTLRDPERGQIALSEELTLLNHYVEIQRLRFGARLSYVLEVDESCLVVPVPPLLLQPLVENAIRYGVEPSEKPEKVLVRGQMIQGRLTLEVINTAHPDPLDVQTSTPSTGVGLANTKARLQATYFGSHSFQYGPLPEGGFRVRIEIPHPFPLEHKS